jgi:hypothetical protein
MSSTFWASMALRSRLSFVLSSRTEGQHFAEHGGGFSKRQWRRGHQSALTAGQHLMHAMAEFMGERHHVARLAHIVDEHIRMRGGNGRMREGARRLAGADRGVDPAAVEEAAGRSRPFPARSAVGGENGVARFVPGDDRVRRFGQRRVAIPVVHLLHAEPLRLHRIITVRQARIGFAHGRGQRIDHLRARRGWQGGGCRRCPRKPRQRSEISLSLASVLVISVKVRMFSLKVAASASRPCAGPRGSGILQLCSARSPAAPLRRRYRSAAPPSSRRTGGSRRRPVCDFSRKSCSIGRRAGRACPCAGPRSRGGSARQAHRCRARRRCARRLSC